jgi:hypothetical protein
MKFARTMLMLVRRMSEGQASRRSSHVARKRVADADITLEATPATGSGRVASAASRKRELQALKEKQSGVASACTATVVQTLYRLWSLFSSLSPYLRV